jgi:serine/threonine protein kinase/Tol biopolymer transport system component
MIGKDLLHYHIEMPLGAGGMGEVYRARDKKLGRAVALKILPEVFARDPDRIARFEREAKLLASLNHSNIAALYGLEQAEGRHFLVMELVEGATLAKIIADGSIPLEEILKMARQIAEALEAAHEHGIVHRDVKPANIKVTRAGKVKVLDFGLAKAFADQVSASDMPTRPAEATRDGWIQGTPTYMSPEQARGKQGVDKRTDIWSFGCVLYEMLTRQHAFPGDTVSDTISSVLTREPDWSMLPQTAPSAVVRLLRRCFEKDPNRRLRDMGDVRLELEDAALAAPSTIATTTPSRSHRDWLAWAVAGILAVILVASFATGALLRPGARSPAIPTFSRIVRLTSGPAREFAPAISPDGKWVAYISDTGGVSNVWVKFIAGGEPVNLTASTGLDITSGAGQGGLDISPDGSRIAVIAKPHGGTEGFNTWEIPAPLPGIARKLLDGNLAVRWSPDGRQITYMRAGGLAGDALFVADADGTNPREIVKATDGWHNHWPTWSRDGKIYFIHTVSGVVGNAEPSEIYRVDARGGEIEPVVQTTRRAVFPVPMPDGSGLIYATNPDSAELALWWRPAGQGEPVRLTTGIGEYAEPRISPDRKTLVCTLYEIRESLYRISVNGGQAEPVALMNGFGGEIEPSIAPDGERMVFTSTRSGNRHLWTARIDGTDARPLTSGSSMDQYPAFSPDGRQLAFISDRGGKRAIWRIDPNGGAPQKVVDVPALDSTLSWSADGNQIIYTAGAGDWPGLWTVSVADGQIKRLSTPGPAIEPALSPTHKLLAYMLPSTSGPQVTRLGFIDMAGAAIYTNLPRPPGTSGFSNGMPAWAPDGRRLAVLSQTANAPSSIWIIDPESFEPYRMLIEFPAGPRIRGLTWTPDGSSIIFGKRETSSDIVLMDQGQ